MSEVDRIIDILDRGIAAGPASDDSYEPFGTNNPMLCWRCAHRLAGVGASGVCGPCRMFLLEERGPVDINETIGLLLVALAPLVRAFSEAMVKFNAAIAVSGTKFAELLAELRRESPPRMPVPYKRNARRYGR